MADLGKLGRMSILFYGALAIVLFVLGFFWLLGGKREP